MPRIFASAVNVGSPHPIFLPESEATDTLTNQDTAYVIGIYAGFVFVLDTEVEVDTNVDNVRILMENYADAATITATPAMVATLPVENVQTLSRAKVARTNGNPTFQVMDFEMPASELANALVLVGVNFTGSATFRLQAWNRSAMGGQKTVDTPFLLAIEVKSLGDLVWGVDPLGASLMDGWAYRYTLLWFQEAKIQSFRVTISDPTNSDGYMELSRLMLGRYFSPAKNMAYGLEMGWIDKSSQYRTDGGTLRSDPLPSYRRWRFSLEAVENDERNQLLDHIRAVGRRNDLFMSCFPGAGGRKEIAYAGHVKLVSDGAVFQDHFPGISRVDLEFEEV